MKEYTTEFIRNIALVSHGSAGKSMLAEAFLHVTGATTRLGKIDDGTTTSDYLGASSKVQTLFFDRPLHWCCLMLCNAESKIEPHRNGHPPPQSRPAPEAATLLGS